MSMTLEEEDGTWARGGISLSGAWQGVSKKVIPRIAHGEKRPNPKSPGRNALPLRANTLVCPVYGGTLNRSFLNRKVSDQFPLGRTRYKQSSGGPPSRKTLPGGRGVNSNEKKNLGSVGGTNSSRCETRKLRLCGPGKPRLRDPKEPGKVANGGGEWWGCKRQG